jgi:hypothetical protein
MRSIRPAGLLGLATLFGACATIMHGTHQDVGISSTPSSASVMVDNKPLGNTPVIAALKRGDNHIIKIELTGYAPFEATLTKKVSGWVWGNIVFGGLTGLAVDAITGGLYSLTPEQVAGQLARQGASTQVSKNRFYVFLVAKPVNDWQQIGTLTPF